MVETTALPTDLMNVSNHILMVRLEAAQLKRQDATREEFHLEQALIVRMQEQEATELQDDDFSCKLKQPAKYDQFKLIPLLELLSTPEKDRCYQEAWTEPEPEVHPARWDMAKLRPLSDRLGGRIQEVVRGARILGDPDVIVKRRHHE